MRARPQEPHAAQQMSYVTQLTAPRILDPRRSMHITANPELADCTYHVSTSFWPKLWPPAVARIHNQQKRSKRRYNIPPQKQSGVGPICLCFSAKTNSGSKNLFFEFSWFLTRNFIVKNLFFVEFLFFIVFWPRSAPFYRRRRRK